MRLYTGIQATLVCLLDISIEEVTEREKATPWFVLTKKCLQYVYLYSYNYATIMSSFLLPLCLALYPSYGPTHREGIKPLQSSRLPHTCTCRSVTVVNAQAESCKHVSF